jgi:geranylgeranyl diphosphate synthase type I
MAFSVMSAHVSAGGLAPIERVEDELASFLAERAAELAPLGADLDPVAAAARGFVLAGGKRLRPLFAYWGWRSVQDEAADDAGLITAAASLELLHACALMHDDVMDASLTRRGKRSAHAEFAELHRAEGWTGDPDVFGTAAAILLGDLLLCWADALYARAPIPEHTAGRAREVFDGMRQLVMAGQYLDVLTQARGEFSADEALRVIEFKTSKYTVEGPLHLGAAIAGAGTDVLAVLSAYGRPLGQAFQLRDDVLGVFGDPSVTGKPAGDDLREGKHTLLTAFAMERASDAEATLLTGCLGDRSLDDAQIAALREVIVATGALDRVEQRIIECADESRQALNSPLVSAPCRDMLGTLIDAATRRDT